MVLHGPAFGSFRKLLIAGASVVALALLVPQARSLNKGSDFSEDVDSTSERLPKKVKRAHDNICEAGRLGADAT